MRKLTNITLVLLLFAGVCFAAPYLQCPGNGTDSGQIATSVFLNTGYACEQQDKIYSNFTSTNFPSDATLEVRFQQIGQNDIHTVIFNGSFGAAFSITYTVSVDLTKSPNNLIRRISGGVINPSFIGEPTNVKTVSGVAGQITSTPTSPGNPLFVSGTTFTITDSYTPNGGAATSVANAFQEITTPEPLLTVLVGAALLTFGLVARRKKIA